MDVSLLDSDFRPWPAGDDRLKVTGPYNSHFLFNPTNSKCTGETSDGGLYRCRVNASIGGVEMPLSRTTTLLLIGSAPTLDRSNGKNG